MSAWCALLVALLSGLWSGETRPHATLVSTDPRDGAVAAAQPEQIRLRFNEPVSPLRLTVVNDSGIAVPVRVLAQGEEILLSLPAGMHHGTYIVSYRVTSADAHPVGGAIAFAIGQPTSPLGAERLTRDPVGPIGWTTLIRALKDLALLIAAGCSLFLVWVAPFPHERLILASAGSGLLALITVSVGLHGVEQLGHGNLTTLEPWATGMRSSYGVSMSVAVFAASMMVLAACLTSNGLRKGLLYIGAFAAASSLPLTGHGASAGHSVLAAVAIGAHGLAAAFWTGSLVALLVLLSSKTGEVLPLLYRFSRIAMPAVALLLLAGTVFATMQLATLGDLLRTSYGNLVLAKSVLFAALLVLAAYNRFALLPAFATNAPQASGKLRRSVAVEIVVIVLVVFLTANLTQTSPFERHLMENPQRAGAHTAAMTITPGRAGQNRIEVHLRSSEGIPYDPPDAILDISNPAAGLEPLTRKLQRAASGTHVHEGGEMAFPGLWTLEVRMRIDDFEQVTFRWSVDIGSKR